MTFWINWKRSWRIKVAKVIGVTLPSKTMGGDGALLPKIGLPPQMCGRQHGASLLRRCLPKYKRCIVEERGVVASPACIVKALYSIAMMKTKMTPPHSLRNTFSTMLLMLIRRRECESFTRFVARLWSSIYVY